MIETFKIKKSITLNFTQPPPPVDHSGCKVFFTNYFYCSLDVKQR